jgi:hypothetical protein
MLEKTWWKPNGGGSAKSNLKPTKAKSNVLKTNNTNNIQANRIEYF